MGTHVSIKIRPLLYAAYNIFTINSFHKVLNCKLQLHRLVVNKSIICNNLFCVRYSSLNSKLSNCWNCHKDVGISMFCPHCNVLQKLDETVDYFKFFDMKNMVFTIDTTDLKQKFITIQSKLHPDKFSSKGEVEQLLAEKYSALANKAYKTLLDPLDRGIYLLELKTGYGLKETTQTDMKFLHEMMEFNEELESSSCPAELNQLEECNKKKMNDAERMVCEAFTLDDFEAARNYLSKMKYYYSNVQRIKDKKLKTNIVD